MTQRNGSFLKRWDQYVAELVNISAKKPQAIEEKHQQITEGACRVFFKKGYHPTSIREVAQSAGMSMGQLYHYISSKDDVLFLIHKHMQTSWYRCLSDSKIEALESPTEKLALALKISLEFLLENKDLFQFIYTESKYLNKRHLRVVLKMDDKEVVQFWRKMVKDALQEQGVDTDTDIAANLIAYILVFLALRGWNLKDRPVEELNDYVIDFIFKGLGLSRPSSGRGK